MSDNHSPGATAHAYHAPSETRTHIDNRVATSELEASATAGRVTDASGASEVDIRELRHEVRNALTTVAGYAQWLQHQSTCWSDERARRALEAILQGIGRACSLLQDHRHHEQGVRLDLRELVAEAVSQVPPHRIGDIVVRILTVEPLVGAWDGDRIGQVLVNLLDNAIKYSPPSTPIVIELAREAEQARISVRDQGIGIETEALAAIFDGYRTWVARTAASGSGIGLHLCQRLVHAEGGQLGVTSYPGRGSTFWLTLPLATEAMPAMSGQTGGN